MRIEEYTAQELFELLNELDETDSLEAKSLHEDSTRSIMESVCAFSNEPGMGGGVILLGARELKDVDRGAPLYVAEGVDDPDKAQLDISTQCASMFNIPVRPRISVEKVCGRPMLKIFVPELPTGRKPLYRQFAGCDTLKASAKLSMMRDAGLLEMRGKGKATYYVPGGRFPVAKHETTAPQGQTTTPLPEDLSSDLAALGRKAPRERVEELMVRLCSYRAMTKDDLMKYLKRSEATIRHIATSLLGKRLAYLYPEVIHHPNQAYIALEPDGE